MRLKHSGQRTCRTSQPPATPAQTPRSADWIIANPFGNSAIAHVNGHTVIVPMRTIHIKYKQPRTQFITLGVA